MFDLSPLVWCEGSEAMLHALQILGTDTLKVGIGVLDDEAIDPLGVHDGEAEANGSAEVLHVHDEVLEADRGHEFAMTSARFAKVV